MSVSGPGPRPEPPGPPQRPLLTRPPGSTQAPGSPTAGAARGTWWWLLPAAALPLLMVLVLVAVLGIGIRPRDPDLAGAGDPYFPDHGASGYDALGYLVDITVDEDVLGGYTEMTARAEQELRTLHLDLGLEVSRVLVDGVAADFWARDGFDLEIRPAGEIPPGQRFVVRVDYAGDPAEVSTAGLEPGTSPWWRETVEQQDGEPDGVEQGVAGEPQAAAWWFPSADHPSDPALMEVKVRVPRGVEAISVGELVSRDVGAEEDWDTWHWRASEPMATYLAFVMVGRYRIDQGTVAGRPYVYAVSERLPEAQQSALLSELAETPQWIAELERDLGPYPFSEMGGVVPPFDFWFGGLETQTRPIYRAGSLATPDFADSLLVHELAHMWFGDHVTLHRWDDIFNNEGWASYLEWVVAERQGGPTPDEQMLRTYERFRDEPDFWTVPLDDPGAERIFATVYQRGPMALQALRNLIGDDAFLPLMRGWASDGGTRSVEDLLVRARASTDVDLDPWYEAWFRATTAPEPLPELGFGA